MSCTYRLECILSWIAKNIIKIVLKKLHTFFWFSFGSFFMILRADHRVFGVVFLQIMSAVPRSTNLHSHLFIQIHIIYYFYSCRCPSHRHWPRVRFIWLLFRLSHIQYPIHRFPTRYSFAKRMWWFGRSIGRRHCRRQWFGRWSLWKLHIRLVLR